MMQKIYWMKCLKKVNLVQVKVKVYYNLQDSLSKMLKEIL